MVGARLQRRPETTRTLGLSLQHARPTDPCGTSTFFGEDLALIRHRWRSHIKNAANEAALLAVTNKYLKEWTWAERLRLPQDAWPGRIESAKSLSEWTFRLAELNREFQDASWPTVEGLQNLLLFFTHASVRMAQLSRSKEGSDTELES